MLLKEEGRGSEATQGGYGYFRRKLGDACCCQADQPIVGKGLANDRPFTTS